MKKAYILLLIILSTMAFGCEKQKEDNKMEKVNSTVIPRVKEQYLSGEYLNLSSSVKYFVDNNIADVGVSSLKVFIPEINFEASDLKDCDIYFSYNENISKHKEYYEIHIDKERITVIYSDNLGARNASSTIALLINKQGTNYKLPCGVIKDYPDNQYRSALLESSGRAWKDIEELKDDLTCMALAKMNYMNFHLLDYMGSSIKFDNYPKIKGFGKENKQFTKEQIRDLISFAESIGIEIIPGLEMPAHGAAILEALPGLKCSSNSIPNTWVLCAGNNMSYTVLENIIKEIAELFPSKYIHIGADELDFGDETAWQPAWMDCARCKSLCEKEGFSSEREIFYYVIKNIYNSIKNLDKQMIMFNDQIDISVSVDLPKDIIIHFWRIAMPGRGPIEGCSLERFLEEGFTVINSYYPETYVDFEYYATEASIRVWTPHSSPEFDQKYASQIIGGELCAWEEHSHYKYTLASAIVLYGDRMWDNSVCEYDDQYGQMMTRLILGINTPDNFNVFKYLGSVFPPRDDVNMAYLDKIDASNEELTKIRDEILLPIKNIGGYGAAKAEAYIECINWVISNR